MQKIKKSYRTWVPQVQLAHIENTAANPKRFILFSRIDVQTNLHQKLKTNKKLYKNSNEI